jgi:flagellin
MSISGGTVKVEGALVHGDTFSFDLNDVEVEVTYSTVDEYTNDAAGLGAQIKDKIDELVAAGTITSPVEAVDNGDGTVSISVSEAPVIASPVATDTTSTSDKSVSVTGNTVSVVGTWAATDAVSVDINGTTVSYTSTANDGFDTTATGVAAGLAKAIQDQDGLENVTVVDNNDGTLTITQATTPVLEAPEVALNNSPTASLTFDDGALGGNNETAKITVGGTFEAGQTYSFKFLGREISVTASTDDAFDDSKEGVAAQLAAAINDAGIAGITAAKTSNEASVTITGAVEVSNAQVLNGSQFLRLTDGTNESATAMSGSSVDLNLDGAAATGLTAASYTSGDSYSFDILGESFVLTVGTDGYDDSVFGVTTQMIDLINARGIAGLNVEAKTAAGTTAGVALSFDFTDVTTGSGGSTIMTDIVVMNNSGAVEGGSAGPISVADADDAVAAIARIDAAIETVNTQRADLGAESNRLDSTVNNLANIVINLEDGRSRIQDADFAVESANLAKQQIMLQAGTAMLAQANASQQNVLSLLG